MEPKYTEGYNLNCKAFLLGKWKRKICSNGSWLYLEDEQKRLSNRYTSRIDEIIQVKLKRVDRANLKIYQGYLFEL